MKRYFTYKKPDAFWERLGIAFWEYSETGMLEYKADGTTKTSPQSLNTLANRDKHPELTYTSASLLLDKPWELVEEGWRLLEPNEKPQKGDQYWATKTSQWKDSDGRNYSMTVAEYTNGSTIKAYRRRVSVHKERYFLGAGYDDTYWTWYSADKQTFTCKGKESAASFGLEAHRLPAYFREVTLPEALAHISVNNNKQNKEEKSSMTATSKFKVGDKVRCTNNDQWAKHAMEIVSLYPKGSYSDGEAECCVRVKHPTHGESSWTVCNLTLAKPSLPTQFQVDTRGLEGVKRTLVRLGSAWAGCKVTYPEVCYMDSEYPLFFFKKGQNVFHRPLGQAEEGYPLLSLDEAITILTTKPEPKVREVKLNDTYTAVVTQGKDTVKVGCQEIPISALHELVKACEEVGK